MVTVNSVYRTRIGPSPVNLVDFFHHISPNDYDITAYCYRPKMLRIREKRRGEGGSNLYFTVLIFPHGGCRVSRRGELTSIQAMQWINKLLTGSRWEILITPPLLQTKTVVIRLSLPQPINLVKFAKDNGPKWTRFEPELFTAVRIVHPQLSLNASLCINVFATGVVIIMGRIPNDEHVQMIHDSLLTRL